MCRLTRPDAPTRYAESCPSGGAPPKASKGRSGGTLDGTASAVPWGEAGTTRPGNLRARTRQLTSQAYEGIAVHRYGLPGDSQGTTPLRPAAVPRQDHHIDPRHGQDGVAHFWASGDDTTRYPTTGHGHSAYGTPGRSRIRRHAADGRTPQRRDGRRGEHRRGSRTAWRKRWLLVPVAALAAALTGGIALAATGNGIHFGVASPVTVQALGMDFSNAAVGQTVTAGAKVVAERATTLSDVALAVKGPDGTRVDFPHAHGWRLGTSQKVFIRSKAFNRAGTYTYWFAYKKNGRWIGLNPRRTFTVGGPSTPTPGATTPGATPSASGSAAPTAGPTSPGATPSASGSATPTAGPTTAPSPTGSPTGGVSSGGSTSPSTNPSLRGCVSNPGSCGYPTTDTAGVPAGTALTVINGGYTVTSNGAVVEGKEIHGCIDVRATNVTIRNTRIIGPCAYGVSTYSAGGKTVLDRVEINCTDGHGTGLAGPNFAAHAVYIHDCENALEINANSSVVDSVLSAREGSTTAHGDGIQSQDGNNVVIRHNTLLEINPVTSAIITNPTLNNGWLIEDNFMGGGAYTLYCPEQGTNFVVRNNRFVPAKLGSLYSAAYGLTDACGHAGITWTGNYRDSDGSAVAP